MNDLRRRFPYYSRLLRLYPAAYRRQYETQLLQTTADMLDGAAGHSERLRIWTKLIIDVPAAIAGQQLKYAGVTMKQSMPTYIKRNGLIGGLLLVPFVASVAADGFDRAINHHNLDSSWVWGHDVLRFWALGLPTVAAGFMIANLMFYTVRGGKGAKPHWRQRLLDWRCSWPLLLSGFAALGIIGFVRYHDSVGCWIQMPKNYLSHHGRQQVCHHN